MRMKSEEWEKEDEIHHPFLVFLVLPTPVFHGKQPRKLLLWDRYFRSFSTMASSCADQYLYWTWTYLMVTQNQQSREWCFCNSLRLYLESHFSAEDIYGFLPYLSVSMKKKTILRLISLAMLIIAVIFVACALCCPTLGTTIYIGSFAFGAEQWRICYALYVVVMIALFGASFFVKERAE